MELGSILSYIFNDIYLLQRKGEEARKGERNDDNIAKQNG
jgi:hypothetical protein